MSYMKDVDIWLTELWLDVLDSAISEVDFKKQIKDKILESYHNGLDAKEYRYSLTAKGGQALENSSQEQSVKKDARGETKPRRFWPRPGREGRQ